MYIIYKIVLIIFEKTMITTFMKKKQILKNNYHRQIKL